MFSESSSEGYFVKKSMYLSRTRSLFLGVVNVLFGLIISIDSVACLSEKYSSSVNLRQNFLISALSSIEFILGTGVIFSSCFVNTCLDSSLMLVEGRFISFGLTVSVIGGRRVVYLVVK